MKKQNTHIEPERVRRKLAEEYRREAGNIRRNKAERATFLRMAESWEKTLSNAPHK